MAKGTDGFAGRLSELKERSGRSYGALARQLHMSTSTLHRYCNGEAVPTDYAPVERFARLCGATPDEQVELHRQWILADEARRRGRAGTAGTAGTVVAARGATARPDSGSGPGPGAGPARGQGPVGNTDPGRAEGRDPASGEAAEKEAVPGNDSEPGREPDSVRGSATAPVRVAGSPPGGCADPDPAPAPDHVSDPDPVEEVAPAPQAADPAAGPALPGPRPAVRRRRFRIAVTAAAVAALAVPAAFAVNRIGGDAPAPDSRGKARQEAPAASAPGDPAGGSPSASASASASPGGSARPGKGAGGRSSAPAGRGTAEPSARVSGGAAPSVGISSYNWDAPCGEYYLLEQKPEQAAPPPVPQDTRRWARTFGAVAGGHMRLQLTVTGNTDASVVLTDLNVRVVGRKAPLPWQAYSMGDGCGGGITPQTFDVDLDGARPLAVPEAGQDGDRVVPAKDFPYKVSTSDPQVLNLDVHTEGHEVSWYLELAWSSGDKSGTIRVDDAGKPFRTSALEGRERYSYWPDKHEWIAE
ncbi:helix-turn-helix domain-containing protein [Streptomyces wuyuanensis]|uniref:helix-turn-helix domain-containing protein n=1 Tax=Streptomyces wuyuanensis TaxID=1196353 RepID=UPI00378D349A